MTTVNLTDEQLENVQREMMKSAAEFLSMAANDLSALSEVALWDSADTQNRSAEAVGSLTLARRDLESLDALGWPGRPFGFCRRSTTPTIGFALERLLRELHPGHSFAVEVWEVAHDDAEDRATSPESVA